MDDKSVCNEKYFKKLFEMHAKVLKNYIYYKSGDLQLSDDVVQEAFIKLWNNCEKIPFDRALFFLKKISKNFFLNTKKHEKVVLDYKLKKVHPTSTFENPQFLLEEKEFAIKIKSTIESLPTKLREVFLLNRIDKMKYKEIAVLLDISVKTVEKRMNNALKIVHKEIGKV